MKKFAFSAFAIVAVLVLGASRASASPIPFAAGDIQTDELNTAGSHDNWSSGTHVTLHPNETASTIQGTGSLSAANGLHWTEPASLSLTSGTLVSNNVWTFDAGHITFTLTSDTVGFDSTFVIISGIGYFSEAGFQNTPGTFSYSASDSTSKSGKNTSSASETFDVIVPTPEPSSLVLLGSGLLGAAFLLFRRNRSAAKISA